MINERLLDDLLTRGIGPQGLTVADLNSVKVTELVRLARLGLWAEKLGISAVEQAHKLGQEYGSPKMDNWLMRCDLLGAIAGQALAALPKGKP